MFDWFFFKFIRCETCGSSCQFCGFTDENVIIKCTSCGLTHSEPKTSVFKTILDNVKKNEIENKKRKKAMRNKNKKEEINES